MLPFRTILVAADFSENSIGAFRLACAMAREFKTRVVVLHVVAPLLVDAELGMPFPVPGGERVYHESLKRDLHDFYPPERLVEVEYCTQDGPVAEQILRMTEEAGSDLVVLGTHGRTGLDRLLSGSVAEAVLRRANCPVLVLRSHDRVARSESEDLASSASTGPRGLRTPIRTILHPTDLSGPSSQAFQVACSLVRDFDARLVVLHVLPDTLLPVYGADQMSGACSSFLEGYKEAVAQELQGLKAPGLDDRLERRIEEGAPAGQILRAAEELACDLIVMGTHGRTGLRRVLMGSVAEEVMRHAPCPVLAANGRVTAASVASAAEAAEPVITP